MRDFHDQLRQHWVENNKLHLARIICRTLLYVLYIFIYLIFTKTFRGKYQHYFHFSDKETITETEKQI